VAGGAGVGTEATGTTDEGTAAPAAEKVCPRIRILPALDVLRGLLTPQLKPCVQVVSASTLYQPQGRLCQRGPYWEGRKVLRVALLRVALPFNGVALLCT